MKGLEPGDHVCWIFDDSPLHEQLTTEFIAEGLSKHHKILFIATNEEWSLDVPPPQRLTKERIVELLHQQFVDVDSALASGQLECMAVQLDSSSNMEDAIEDITTKTQDAITSGFTALRITSDFCVQTLPSKPAQEKHIRYEAKLTKLCQERPVIGLCSYDRRNFHEKLLFKVLCAHPKTAINGEFTNVTNFYYVPPEKYLSEDAQRAVYAHSMSNMLERHKRDFMISQQMEGLVEKNEQLQMEIEGIKRMDLTTTEQQPDHPLSKVLQSTTIVDMSHDIRSPLNGIIASASLLSTSVTPEQRELVETIEASSTQLMQVLSDIIDHPQPSRSPQQQSQTNNNNNNNNINTNANANHNHNHQATPSPSPISTSSVVQRLQSHHLPKTLDILLVEDNLINQTVLKKMLHKLGYPSPKVVGDGESAVEACKLVDYDVIFMDIFLPNMDGLTATREINAIYASNTARKKPTIVAVTASVTKEIRNECLEVLGMAAFVSKPVKMDVFTNVFMDSILPNLQQ